MQGGEEGKPMNKGLRDLSQDQIERLEQIAFVWKAPLGNGLIWKTPIGKPKR